MPLIKQILVVLVLTIIGSACIYTIANFHQRLEQVWHYLILHVGSEVII
jgi:hypothetical protein